MLLMRFIGQAYLSLRRGKAYLDNSEIIVCGSLPLSTRSDTPVYHL